MSQYIANMFIVYMHSSYSTVYFIDLCIQCALVYKYFIKTALTFIGAFRVPVTYLSTNFLSFVTKLSNIQYKV